MDASGLNRFAVVALVLAVAAIGAVWPGPASAAVVFSEDFEGGIGSWYASNGLWQVGVATVGPGSAHSDTACAGTVLNGNYPHYADTRFVSPRITLPTIGGDERIWVRFWECFWMENGDDRGRVQISDDNGVTWATVGHPDYQEGTGKGWCQCCVDISAYAGSEVRLGFYLTSDSYYEYAGWYVDDVSVETGTFLFEAGEVEDFSEGIGDWSADNGLWQVGEPGAGPGSAHSDSLCAGTVLGGNYPAYANTRLVSPRIHVPSVSAGEYVCVRFWQCFWMENGDDRGRIQVSEDGGATWTTVGHPDYQEGTGKGWSQTCVDITDYAGGEVRLGFYLTSDSYYEYAGWYIDDVSIETGAFELEMYEVEDFECGVGDWSADNGLWQVGVPTYGPGAAHSDSMCAGTVLYGAYPAYANTRLVSPRIHVPDVSRGEWVWARFWHCFWMENGDDTGRVQVTTNDGESWTTLSSPVFEGTGNAWSQTCVDITAYSGQDVRLGFYFASDSYYEYAGWYVDDVSVEAGAFCFPVVGLPSDPQLIEDFESGVGDWSVDNGLWQIGVPTSGPGSTPSGSACAGTRLGGNYPAYANTRLVTPYVSLTPEPSEIPELFFQHWFNTEDGDDLLRVQIRPLGGSWEDLSVPGSPFSGSSGGWTQAYADLGAYADSTVQIGFYLTSDSYYQYAGWFIDDVRFEGVLYVDCPVEGAAWASLADDGSVLLRWTLESLADVRGINVYRSTASDGDYVLVNEEPLSPALSGAFVDASVWPGTTFWYKLRIVRSDGTEEEIGFFMTSIETGGELQTALYPARPNPVLDTTVLQFDAAGECGAICLDIYDVAGRRVRRLWNQATARGRHTVTWDGRDERGGRVASGVYFARLASGSRVETGKLLVLR